VLQPAIGAQQQRVFVAGVDHLDDAGRHVDDAAQHRHLDERVPIVGQFVVERADDRIERRTAAPQQAVRQRLGNRHEQRGGWTLAGDIANKEHDAAVGQRKGVVQVAADGLRRFQQRIEIEPGMQRPQHRRIGQHGALDLARRLHLAGLRQ
jgi:hypothetical protein